VTFVRVKVFFSGSNQISLGDQDRKRVHGYILFTIFVKQGAGDEHRNLIAELISDNFCLTTIGGATLWGSNEMPSQDTENWCMSGVQIPFYYDEV
jgi:hypothetical protein